MKVKPLFLSLFVLLFYVNGFSQGSNHTNCVYAELGGNGFVGSLNYERKIKVVPSLAGRLGLGFNFDYLDTILQFHYPLVLGLDYLFVLDSAKSFIDAGAGLTFQSKQGSAFDKKYRNIRNIYSSLALSCGYRRIYKNNFMFRISLLFISNEIGSGPWLGVSIGKSF